MKTFRLSLWVSNNILRHWDKYIAYTIRYILTNFTILTNPSSPFFVLRFLLSTSFFYLPFSWSTTFQSLLAPSRVSIPLMNEWSVWAEPRSYANRTMSYKQMCIATPKVSMSIQYFYHWNGSRLVEFMDIIMFWWVLAIMFAIFLMIKF